MQDSKKFVLSVVVPLYNESGGLAAFHDSLIKVLQSTVKGKYEIIYCDDGSNDGTGELIQGLHRSDPSVKLISLSRNFGKENALAAGIAAATGDAVLTIDGDGQHPVDVIPNFIEAWQKGARIVVGLSTNGSGGSIFKRICSRLFYSVFNKITDQKLLSGATDFRLIDRSVQAAFLRLQESDRITRGLIDWLGFNPIYIDFQTKPRLDGKAVYGMTKLAKLAMHSVVSLSPMPLYIFGYLGVIIATLAFTLGVAVGTEQLLMGDPWGWRFTGTAMLSILVLFLVGVILMSQGLLSLYVSHIHSQSKQRPLYVIDYQKSAGIDDKKFN